MRPDSNIGQGRNGAVPQREWNWAFIFLLGGGWLFIGLVIAGCWAWGWPFAAGLALMGVGLGVFGCWGLGRAAPW